MRNSAFPVKSATLRRKSLALAVCAAGLCLLQGTALAAEWTRSASVSVGQVYSDNVELESEDENSDFFSTVMPSVSVQGKGARASVDLNAAVEMNDRSGGGGNFNPLLNATANAELIEDFFYTDVFARANQTVTDPFQASSNTALSSNENTGTTYKLWHQPSIRKRWAASPPSMPARNGMRKSAPMTISTTAPSGATMRACSAGRISRG